VDTALQQVLLIVGIAILAFACRTFVHPLVRKAGALAILAASYLAAFFIFDSHVAGLGAVLAWFFLPWIQLLTRVRSMRLPIDKKLRRKAPPSPDRFPLLDAFTQEVEAEGFEHVEDVGWEWEDMSQFFRILYNEKDKVQATICMNEQDSIAFAYVAITSRDHKGHGWRTWNYPFSYTMKISPEMHVNRVENATTFNELLHRHQAYLQNQHLQRDDLVQDQPEQIHGLMEVEVRQQIDYNLSNGLILLSDRNTFRYSWRGLFFLWTQFLKDMVKLS